jgi:TPR repeat protein
MTRADLEQAAVLYDEAADELDRAARHCKVAAGRFREGNVPSGTAHAWAAIGHLREAEERLDDQARQHRTKAHLE